LAEPAGSIADASERLEPERRSLRGSPELGSPFSIETDVDRERELDPLLERQRRELDHGYVFGGQRFCERSPSLPGTAGREDREALLRIASGPDQVVAERVGELVHPLHVVDDEQRLLERRERTVRSFEQTHRLERSTVLWPEQERLQAGAVPRDLEQRPEQSDHSVPCLGKEPAFPAARIADDDCRCDAASDCRADCLAEGRELVCAPYKNGHVPKRTTKATPSPVDRRWARSACLRSCHRSRIRREPRFERLRASPISPVSVSSR
jgi:hypothetical protein